MEKLCVNHFWDLNGIYFVILWPCMIQFFFKVLWFLGSLKVLHVNMVLIETEKLVIVTLQF